MAITSQQMKELEDYAEKKGISKFELMENSGKAVFELISKEHDFLGKHIIIFAGHGNNGGDGFVIARYFAEFCNVLVLFFGKEEKLKDEARKNYLKIKDNVTIFEVETSNDLKCFKLQNNIDYIFIDALLGTGIKIELREPLLFGINYFNECEAYLKVAIDVPSGVNPDTGESGSDKEGQIHECNVDLIVTFHNIKLGLEKRGDLKEQVRVVDIGIPVEKPISELRIKV
ncbi:NAD(P)H-hydrate epimerase [archaeon]|jgi:hydroxyethylthiazole kinase-like uncharacterized protein yjeF|nr:NAD(P)H-hydrate epimerase [archaeon]MBT3450662.1 NAD(P)H-hydrate epimerase [archaeon]MBT6868758.1 NAD(P)H-hydrate epimerase [archaeon]MBT7193021.1 NAD(P)H-hydrate epimerase [archaeon]MBT7380987.1 NAD(P)H-hydrate epimerase [archaeon]